MSYRNPKQFVDTQSAANARRATQGINKGLQSFIAGYTKNKLENEKILKETLQWEMDMRNKVFSAESALGMAAPGMTMAMREELMYSIKRASYLRQQPTLTDSEKIELQNVMQVPDKILSLANNMSLYGANVTNQVKEQGNMGGIDPTANTELTKAMLGLGGNSAIKGKSGFSLDLTNPAGPVATLTFQQEGSDKVMSINNVDLEARIQGKNSELLPIIKDESANMQNAVNLAYYGNEKGEGKIDSALYDGQTADVVKKITYTDGTLRSEIRETKPNEELLISRMQSNVKSYVANNNVTNAQKVGWYNMFQTKLYGEDAKQLEHGELVDEEKLNDLIKDYSKFAIRGFSPPSAIIRENVAVKPIEKDSDSKFLGYNKDSNLTVGQVDQKVNDYIRNLENYINSGNAKIFDDKLDVKGQKIVEARFEDGLFYYRLDLGKDQFSDEYVKDPKDLEDYRELLDITINNDMPNDNVDKRDVLSVSRNATQNLFISKKQKSDELAQQKLEEAKKAEEIRLANQAIALQKEAKRKKEQLKKDQEEWDKYQNMSPKDFPSPKAMRRYRKVFGYSGRGGKDLKPRPTRYEDLNT